MRDERRERKKSRGCYIDVWRNANFEGDSIRIEGPAEYPDLQFSSGNWGDQIGSLRVGPHAFVCTYRDKDFKDEMVAFGPNQEVANLDEMNVDDDIDSIKLIDSLKILDYRPVENEPGTSGDVESRTAADEHPKAHQSKKKNLHKGRHR